MLTNFIKSLRQLQKNIGKNPSSDTEISNSGSINCDLIKAVKNNNFELTEELLKNGAKVNYKFSTSVSSSPLYQAYINRNIDLAKLLIKHGADINLKDEKANSWLWNNIFSQNS